MSPADTSQAALGPAPAVPKPRTRSGLRTAAKAIVLALAAVAAVVVWRERPRDARVALVDKGAVAVEIPGTGTVESDEQVTLAFVASGRISSLSVDEGDRVRVGDALGALDVADMEKQAGVARANEGAAATTIAKVSADVARTRAGRDAAAKDLDRARVLASQDAATQAMLDAAQERYDRSEAELAAATAAVTQARASAAAAHEGTGLAARRLEDGRIFSPVEGIVLERKHVVGDVVGLGTPVLTVASTRKIRVRAWVDETALGVLKEGAEARVTLRSSKDQPLRGRVERIGAQADRQTHEVLVDVELLERPERLAFGQRADVAIVAARKADVARAPAGFCDLGGQSCLVERSGRVVRVHATFGLEGSGAVEVLSGLEPGDAVLAPATPDAVLKEGCRVRRTL